MVFRFSSSFLGCVPLTPSLSLPLSPSHSLSLSLSLFPSFSLFPSIILSLPPLSRHLIYQTLHFPIGLRVRQCAHDSNSERNICMQHFSSWFWLNEEDIWSVPEDCSLTWSSDLNSTRCIDNVLKYLQFKMYTLDHIAMICECDIKYVVKIPGLIFSFLWKFNLNCALCCQIS